MGQNHRDGGDSSIHAPQQSQPRADHGAARAVVAVSCGLLCIIALGVAAMLYQGYAPGGTSGEAMFTLVGAFPVSAVGVALAISALHNSRARPLAAVGLLLCGFAMGSVVAIVALVALSWMRCAGSCI